MITVTIIDGNNRISRDLPVVPELNEDIRIVVPGTPDWNLKVRHRVWIFGAMQKPEVQLDCA